MTDTDTLIAERVDDATGDLLNGADIEFKNYPKNKKLTVDDIITRVFEDDELKEAFLEHIQAAPKCKLRELFDFYANEEATDYAQEEREYLDRLEAENEAIYKADMQGELI